MVQAAHGRITGNAAADQRGSEDSDGGERQIQARAWMRLKTLRLKTSFVDIFTISGLLLIWRVTPGAWPACSLVPPKDLIRSKKKELSINGTLERCIQRLKVYSPWTKLKISLHGTAWTRYRQCSRRPSRKFRRHPQS